jgi:hypothetical protein
MREMQSQLFALIRGRSGDAGRLIVGDDKLDADGRIEIYANMYLARLEEALEEQFPRLAAVLDHEAFHELVRGYVSDRPSRNPSLRCLGEGLSLWLAKHYDPPWLAELAALEYARLDVFDERDERIRTIDELRQMGNALVDLPLRLIRAHRIISFDHAIDETWRTGEAPEKQVTSLLVWRRDTVVSHRAVDSPVEAVALWQAVRGTTVGALCEHVAKHDDQPDDTVFRLLGSWSLDGLLA